MTRAQSRFQVQRTDDSHLTSTGLESIVNLACACLCLEEPVLSTLWETQPSLHTLLKVSIARGDQLGIRTWNTSRTRGTRPGFLVGEIEH